MFKCFKCGLGYLGFGIVIFLGKRSRDFMIVGFILLFFIVFYELNFVRWDICELFILRFN